MLRVGLFVLSLLSWTLTPSPVKAVTTTVQQVPTADSLRGPLLYAFSAYRSPQELRGWTCLYCVNETTGFIATHVIEDNATYTQGYAGVNTRTRELVLAFRGTVGTSIVNWLEDFDFWLMGSEMDGIPGAHLASGFAAAYTAVRLQVQRAVNDLVEKHPGWPLLVTGHSLGAALANIAALDLVVSAANSTYNCSVRAISFEAPRTGDSGFAAAHASYLPAGSSYRVVNDRDLVPHWAPRVTGLHHVATELWLRPVAGHPRQPVLRLCDGSGEDPSCSDSVMPWQLSVAEHDKIMGVQCCGPPVGDTQRVHTY